MNAFEFGWLMQKIAASGYQQPARTPPPAPQFNFAHGRQMLAKHDPNYSDNMTSRQVWERAKELGTIAPGTRKLTPFQTAMKYRYKGRIPAEPVFAQPGRPGYKPSPPAINGVAAAGPQMPQGQARGPAQNPPQLGPNVNVPYNTYNGPILPTNVRNDLGNVVRRSPENIELMNRTNGR